MAGVVVLDLVRSPARALSVGAPLGALAPRMPHTRVLQRAEAEVDPDIRKVRGTAPVATGAQELWSFALSRRDRQE